MKALNKDLLPLNYRPSLDKIGIKYKKYKERLTKYPPKPPGPKIKIWILRQRIYLTRYSWLQNTSNGLILIQVNLFSVQISVRKISLEPFSDKSNIKISFSVDENRVVWWGLHENADYYFYSTAGHKWCEQSFIGLFAFCKLMLWVLKAIGSWFSITCQWLFK